LANIPCERGPEDAKLILGLGDLVTKEESRCDLKFARMRLNGEDEKWNVRREKFRYLYKRSRETAAI
jgi:hypothetical protein